MRGLTALSNNELQSNRNEALRRLVNRKLKAIPRPYLEVLIMCDIEGFPWSEVAPSLTVRSATVARRLARGREMLELAMMREGIIVTKGELPLLAAIHLKTTSLRHARLIESAE